MSLKRVISHDSSAQASSGQDTVCLASHVSHVPICPGMWPKAAWLATILPKMGNQYIPFYSILHLSHKWIIDLCEKIVTRTDATFFPFMFWFFPCLSAFRIQNFFPTQLCHYLLCVYIGIVMERYLCCYIHVLQCKISALRKLDDLRACGFMPTGSQEDSPGRRRI